jgi:hypothetical protein
VIFRTKTGRPFRQASLGYYWHPVRAAFGQPKLAWYALRHFAASYFINVLKLDPWIVAEHLRHDDGGVQVRSLYGHPSAIVARDEIKRAFETNVVQLQRRPGAQREQSHGEVP